MSYSKVDMSSYNDAYDIDDCKDDNPSAVDPVGKPKTSSLSVRPRKLLSFIASKANTAKAKLAEQFESSATRRDKAPTLNEVLRIERAAEISANAVLKQELNAGKISEHEYSMLVEMHRRTLEQNQQIALADHRAMYGNQDCEAKVADTAQ
jgi:hypothetical protein